MSLVVNRHSTDYIENSTLKPGDKLVYQGNDFLTMDKCTGKISGIIIAQDFLDFFYKMGIRLLPL